MSHWESHSWDSRKDDMQATKDEASKATPIKKNHQMKPR